MVVPNPALLKLLPPNIRKIVTRPPGKKTSPPPSSDAVKAATRGAVGGGSSGSAGISKPPSGGGGGTSAPAPKTTTIPPPIPKPSVPITPDSPLFKFLPPNIQKTIITSQPAPPPPPPPTTPTVTPPPPTTTVSHLPTTPPPPMTPIEKLLSQQGGAGAKLAQNLYKTRIGTTPPPPSQPKVDFDKIKTQPMAPGTYQTAPFDKGGKIVTPTTTTTSSVLGPVQPGHTTTPPPAFMDFFSKTHLGQKIVKPSDEQIPTHTEEVRRTEGDFTYVTPSVPVGFVGPVQQQVYYKDVNINILPPSVRKNVDKMTPEQLDSAIALYKDEPTALETRFMKIEERDGPLGTLAGRILTTLDTLDIKRDNKQKLITETQFETVNENSKVFKDEVTSIVKANMPTDEEIKSQVRQSLYDAGYTPANFGQYKKQGIVIDGETVAAHPGGSWTYNTFVKAVTNWQKNKIRENISEQATDAVRTKHKIIKYGNLDYMDVPDDLRYVIKNSDSEEAEALINAFRKYSLNPEGDNLSFMPEQIRGKVIDTKILSRFNKKNKERFEGAFKKAYESLDKNEQKTFNLQYLQWENFKPEEIKWMPGGQTYLSGLSSSQKEQKIREYMESKEYKDYMKSVRGKEYKGYIARSRVVDPFTGKKTYGGDDWTAPSDEAFTAAERKIAQRLLFSPDIESAETKMHDKDVLGTLQGEMAVFEGIVKGASMIVTFPEWIAEEVGGRVFNWATGKGFVPAQIITEETPVVGALSREHIGRRIQEISISKAPPLISASFEQGAHWVTHEKPGGQWWEREGSPTWEQVQKRPLQSIAGGLGEAWGMWVGGKGMGLATKMTKLGVSTGAKAAVRGVHVPYPTYGFKGLVGGKFGISWKPTGIGVRPFIAKIPSYTQRIKRFATDTITIQSKYAPKQVFTKIPKSIQLAEKAGARIGKMGKTTTFRQMGQKAVKWATTGERTALIASTKAGLLNKLKIVEQKISNIKNKDLSLHQQYTKGLISKTQLNKLKAPLNKQLSLLKAETKSLKASIDYFSKIKLPKTIKLPSIRESLAPYKPTFLMRRGYQRITGGRRAPVKEYHEIIIDPATGKVKIVSTPQASGGIPEMLELAEKAKHPVTGEIQLARAAKGGLPAYKRIPITETGDYASVMFKPMPLARGLQKVGLLTKNQLDDIILDLVKTKKLVVAGSKSMKLQTQKGLKWILRGTKDWDVMFRGSIKQTEKIAKSMADDITKATGIKYTIHKGRAPGIFTIYKEGTRVGDTALMDIVSSKAQQGKMFAEKNIFAKIGDIEVLDLQTLVENKILMAQSGKTLAKTISDLQIMTGLSADDIFKAIGGPYGKITSRLAKPRAITTLVKDNIDDALVKTARREQNLILGGSGAMKLQSKLSLAYLKRKIGDWDFLYEGGYGGAKATANRMAKRLETLTGKKGFKVKNLGHEGSYRIVYGKRNIADITSTQSPRMGAHLVKIKGKVPTVKINGINVANLEYLLERKIMMARYGAKLQKSLLDIEIMTGMKSKQLMQFEPHHFGAVIKPKRLPWLRRKFPSKAIIPRSKRLTPEAIETPIKWMSVKGKVPTWPWETGIRTTRRTLFRRQPKPFLEEIPVSQIKRFKGAKDTMQWIDEAAKVTPDEAARTGFITPRTEIIGTTEVEYGLLSGLEQVKQPYGFREHFSVLKEPVPTSTLGKLKYYAKVTYEKYGDAWAKLKGYRDYEILPTGEVIPIRGYRLLAPEHINTIKTSLRKVTNQAKKGDSSGLSRTLGREVVTDGKNIVFKNGETMSIKSIEKLLKPGKSVAQVTKEGMNITSKQYKKLLQQADDYYRNIVYKPFFSEATLYKGVQSYGKMGRYISPYRHPRREISISYRPTYTPTRTRLQYVPYRLEELPSYQPSYQPAYEPSYQPAYERPAYETPRPPPYYPRPRARPYYPYPRPRVQYGKSRPAPPPILPGGPKRKEKITRKRKYPIKYKEREFILPTFAGSWRQPYKPQMTKARSYNPRPLKLNIPKQIKF